MKIDFPLSPQARKCGDGWIDICPAHQDYKPSLSIGIGNKGQLLLHCFAGCSFTEVVAAAGLRGDICPAQMPMADVQRQSEQRQLDAEKALARC